MKRKPGTRKLLHSVQNLINFILFLSRCCAFNCSDLILHNPRDPPFPWELDYLCGSGPLLNMADTAHASKSTVRLLGVTRDGKKREGTGRFIVGDHVSLEVVVRNGRGQVQKLGNREYISSACRVCSYDCFPEQWTMTGCHL